MTPELIESPERFKKLRIQLSHNLIVGIIYHKQQREAEEIIRALTVIQERNPNIKIALVNDSSVLPEAVKSKAISSIIIIRHPIFEEFGGLVEDVIIHHLEDGFTIDED